MPGYPVFETEQRIRPETLLDEVQKIFERCGMSAADAGIVAESLVLADARGVHSHGVLRVPEYVKKLTRDGVDPGACPVVALDSGAAITVDGCNAMGQIVCRFAMEQAIDRARSLGVAVASVRGSNHCGALFPWAMMALPHDMIGIAATNALPTMAPWGGSDKILGINPLAVAFPSGEEPPIVLDAAFSASSHGKLRVYEQKGAPIPEGWALDVSGRPTTDPAEAIRGSLQPIGGYKGAGLAIVMGVLSSMLSGAAFGTELGDMLNGPQAGHDGQFLMALRIGAFEDVAVFKRRIDGLVRQIRACHPAPGFDRCYAPGELEHLTEQQYRIQGIPLNNQTLAGLQAAAAEV